MILHFLACDALLTPSAKNIKSPLALKKDNIQKGPFAPLPGREGFFILPLNNFDRNKKLSFKKSQLKLLAFLFAFRDKYFNHSIIYQVVFLKIFFLKNH